MTFTSQALLRCVRNFCSTVAVTVVCATGLFPTSASASPILYKLTTVLSGMNAWAMNEAGQVAGWGASTYIASIYTPGSGISTIPLPTGAIGSIGYSLNEAGQVAGRLYGLPSYDQNGFYVSHSFIYTPGATPAVQVVKGDIGFNRVLNEAGAIVNLTSPAPSYSTEAIVTSVNNNFSAGYSRFANDSGNGKAWRYNPDGTFTDLSPLLGTKESQAFGVNSSGTVVGRSIPLNSGISAFVYSDGMGALNLFDVTDPASRSGWSSFVSAQDITEDGSIVGWGVYNTPGSYFGTISSFILTPINAVPEPGTFALLLAGICGLTFTRKRS